MKNASEKAEKQRLREEKRHNAIKELNSIQQENPYSKTLYDDALAKLQKAKSRSEIRAIEGTVPFLNKKNSLITALDKEVTPYLSCSAIKQDAVLFAYTYFIKAIIKSDEAGLDLLITQTSLLSNKYEFLVKKVDELSTDLHWLAIVNHIVSLQSEEELNALSQKMERVNANARAQIDLKKRKSALEEELKKLGFNPEREAILSIVSETMESHVQFTEEMIRCCEASIEQCKKDLDFLTKKIEKIRPYMADDHEVIDNTTVAASPCSPLNRRGIEDRDYYNHYKKHAHQMIADAKIAEKLDDAIQLYCLAEHKHFLEKESYLIFTPPSRANLYLTQKIQRANTKQEIKSLYQMFAILKCIQENYPTFLNVIRNFILGQNLDDKAAMVLCAFEALANTDESKVASSAHFLCKIVSFYRARDPENMNDLWHRYSEENSILMEDFETSKLTLDNYSKRYLSQQIDRTLAEKKAVNKRRLELNSDVNECLKSYAFDRESDTQEYKKSVLPSWCLKYNRHRHSKTDKLEAVKRLYERKYLREEDVDCLSDSKLGGNLRRDTKMQSIEELLYELGYIDDTNKPGAKYYTRLTLDFEPCQLVKEAPHTQAIFAVTVV